MVRKPQGYQSPRFGDEHRLRGAEDYGTIFLRSCFIDGRVDLMVAGLEVSDSMIKGAISGNES